jgi:hypothetical protein
MFQAKAVEKIETLIVRAIHYLPKIAPFMR